ncbi:MAG: hypothetical protein QM767_08735 [Anaeromyxobacter sp.]
MRLAVAVAVVTLAACGGSGGSGGGASKLRVSAGTASAVAAPSGGIQAGDGITVDRVRLMVEQIELESEDSSGEGSGGVEVGPFLVDLAGDALTGGVRQTFDAQIPPGTYAKLELKIAPGSALDNHAVVVDGTIDGEPFTFTSDLTAEQEHEVALTVAADGSTNNVALAIDPTAWFTVGDVRLDPRDPAMRASIECQLAASIDAFDDEDEDGIDDHGGHGSDDGPGDDGGGSGGSGGGGSGSGGGDDGAGHT